MMERRVSINTLLFALLLASALVGMATPGALGEDQGAVESALETPEAPKLTLSGAVFVQLDEDLKEHLAKEWDPVAGSEVYNGTCVACHGEDGTGAVPGVPDFTRSDGVLAKGDEVLMKHVEEGFQSPGSLLAMPPKGGDESLTMDDIMNVLAYLHKKFHYKVDF